MAFKYGGAISQAVVDDPNNTFGILLGFLGQNQKILEIGCATGYMTEQMRRLGHAVWGFEIDAAAADLARRHAVAVWVGDLNVPADREQIEGLFDTILIADVLEHLVWPSDLLEFLRRHLAPDGRLIVSLPNVAHWSGRVGLLKGKWELTNTGLMDRTHLRWFTLATGRDLIEKSGYHIEAVDASYIFPAQNRLASIARLAAALHRWPASGWLQRLFGYQLIFVARLK